MCKISNNILSFQNQVAILNGALCANVFCSIQTINFSIFGSKKASDFLICNFILVKLSTTDWKLAAFYHHLLQARAFIHLFHLSSASVSVFLVLITSCTASLFIYFLWLFWMTLEALNSTHLPLCAGQDKRYDLRKRVGLQSLIITHQLLNRSHINAHSIAKRLLSHFK